MKRGQADRIFKDLTKKMVFLVGPRQVGKTFLAKEIARRYEKPAYLNYDRFEDREIIRTESWPAVTDLLILDEVHKMPEWKNHVKGIFDTKPARLHILVTGSARLDTYRQAGDSLAGRFYTHRLLPFSPAELRLAASDIPFSRLLERGGFPEPLLAEEQRDAARWRDSYADSLIRTDVLDFERVHDLKAIRLIFELLRRKVGSPVSFASIARDVQVSPTTVLRYVEILEALYIIFRVTPYSTNISRSLLKEPKIYFFDTGLVVGDEGCRLENLAAVCLLKHVLARRDIFGEARELNYLRTKDGREVDFCLSQDEKVELAIEVKNADSAISAPLRYFCETYGFKGIQAVHELKRERSHGGIDIRSIEDFLRELFL